MDNLTLYLNRKVHTYVISQQKFIAFIITSILSTSLILTYSTSNDSYYMSVPYLAPTVFMFGAIIVFYTTFSPSEKKNSDLYIVLNIRFLLDKY